MEKRPSKNIHLHARAGTLDKNGYRYISLLGKRYPEHRLIWCLVHGQFPDGDIDHINQIRDDNRLENLRVVSKAENARNRTRKNSRLDEVGIWWCKTRKRYVAEITKNGKRYIKNLLKILMKPLNNVNLNLLNLVSMRIMVKPELNIN